MLNRVGNVRLVFGDEDAELVEHGRYGSAWVVSGSQRPGFAPPLGEDRRGGEQGHQR